MIIQIKRRETDTDQGNPVWYAEVYEGESENVAYRTSDVDFPDRARRSALEWYRCHCINQRKTPEPEDTIELRRDRVRAYRAGLFIMEVPPTVHAGWDEESWCNWVKFTEQRLSGFLPRNANRHREACAGL